jgi:hypothetical protein
MYLSTGVKSALYLRKSMPVKEARPERMLVQALIGMTRTHSAANQRC